MEFDASLIPEFILSVIAVLTWFDGRRRGLRKNKSIDANTVKTLHDIAMSDATVYRKRLAECDQALMNAEIERERYKGGFRIRGAELRKLGVKFDADKYITAEKLEELTVAEIETYRNNLSNT